MKRTTVWALALALAGITVVSCDSTSSPPPADAPADTTGTGAPVTPVGTPASITRVTPYSGDTTVGNDVTSLTIKFTTGLKPAGVTVKINGLAYTAVTPAGEYSYKTPALAVGISKFLITAVSTGKIDTSIVSVTRQLGAPVIKGLGGQADQTDFTDSVRVQLSSADLATDSIRFTTNGSTSKISSADPLVASGYTKTIKGTTTFRAIAMRRNSVGTVYSDTTTVTFVIGKTLSRPYFSTNRVDSFLLETKIGIGGYGVSDTVRYTTDGGDPTRDSRIYSKTDSILIQDSSTIIAKSFSGSNQSSAPCTTSIKLKAQDPIFSVKTGTYTSQRLVNIKSPSGIPVYYTTDGTTPTSQSLKAGDSLYIDSNVTVKAIASRQGWRTSKVVSASYKFKVATPTLSFRTGSYDTTQTLTITDSAAGASIRYTVNGAAPTCASTLYDADSLLKLDSNVTIKALACKTGWDSSAVATGSYTFKVAKISFSPDSAVYRNNQIVKLSTRSPGVSFYVTRDSSAPAWNAAGPIASTQKVNPGDTLLINKSQWLRVVAVRNGWAISSDDARRYIVEGDTLLVDDFEQNSLTRPIGYNWRFWACGYCENTGISDQMETKITEILPDSLKSKIGFRAGHISFKMPAGGARRISDGRTGPGYAGLSVGVPSSLMGETYRIVFWARWKKSGTSPDSVPMVTEMAWKNNDNQNGYYHDGFHRYVERVGPTWQKFVLDYSAFYASSNAYDYTVLSDSTASTPKSYWIIAGYPDASRMLEMGLSKFQGQVWHDGDWKPRWTWGADHDGWSKNNITAFRWSIIQPNSNTAELSSLSHRDSTMFIRGTDTTYCGDCHDPVEPGYSPSLLSGYSTMEGSLEIDRVQLVRRPQPSGGITGTDPVVVVKEEPVVPVVPK